MKHRNWRPAAWAALFSIGLAACAVQSQDAVKEPKPIDSPRMLKIIAPELLARLVALANSAKTCEIDTQAVCEIQMSMIRVPDQPNGKTYCVAVAPDVKVRTDPFGGLFNKRRIAWKLVDQNGADIASLDGKALVFHEDAGIVITIDDPTSPQVDKRGQRGDGIVGQVLNWRFHTLTRRNRLGASATYLPVILWGPSGDEELCAAVDPKIVNV